MAADLFLFDPLPAVGARAVLGGPEGRHAATVRRVPAGAELVLTDGRGSAVRARVLEARAGELELEIVAAVPVSATHPAVTVVQAIPKSDRAELAVDLMTEAGVDAIVPWQASRSVSKWGAKAERNVERWRTTASVAAKQARRVRVPEVHPLLDTAGLLAWLRAARERGAVVLVLHEEASVPIASVQFAGADEVVLIVGPEGGVAPDEVAAFVELGAKPVLLGPEVLRTVAAGAVALGALGVLTGRWGERPVE